MDIQMLRIAWFCLIAALWIGFLVLEGFDFGVGTLLRVIGKSDAERRATIETIGPVWDANEVWLITAGGAMFAAFPLWYANFFSSFYLALLLILLALIVRGVAIKYRTKIDSPRWRSRWDSGIVFGSVLPAFLFGVALGNMVRGMRQDELAGGPFVVLIAMLKPYPLLTGLVTLSVFTLHGALFLALKTKDDIHDRAKVVAARLAPIVAAITAFWVIWTQLKYGKWWMWVLAVLAAAAVIAVVLLTREGRVGISFTLTCTVIILAAVMVFAAKYPFVFKVLGDADASLTIETASSTQNTLTVMTWVALFMMPIVIAYQAWTYWVFRRRITATGMSASAGLKWELPKSFLAK